MAQKKPIVVISGMSGRFPGVNNVADYAESLYNKKELVGPVKGRFPTDGLFEELPNCIGRVNDFEKFDHNFFNIKPELAKLMDPQAKKMLEVTLEAILDAGLSLDQIKGSRTASYYAHIYADLDRTLKVNDFIERQNECSDPQIAFYRQMYQEWVAYCLDLTGPTYHYESACSSAMYAFSDAFKAIQLGLIDTALVITTNLNIAPNIIIQYLRLGIMSRSGVCRFADANADGYIKSEAACCLVLQRYEPNLSNVKRIYSKIVNTKCNSDGFKMEGITFPKTETQYQLIKETFEEVNLKPTQVNYVEAHGTGTQTGDIQELNCIDSIFNDEINFGKRTSPLYVGSVKSNVGHAESSSGILSIIKCLFCFQYDLIPPVINYSTPNPNVSALLNGRIKIVTDKLPLNTDLISVSSFGFGGSNTHVILQNAKSIKSVKDNHISIKRINSLDGYQLVNLAARSEEGLIDGLKKLAQQFRAYDINLNEIYLLNDVVYREQVKLGFNHTGHIIINTKNLNEEPKIHLNNEFVNSSNIIDYHHRSKSPDQLKTVKKNKLFFALPGLGCQFDGMSVGLIDVPFFNRRVKELCELIQPELDFDIYKMMIAKQNDSSSVDFCESIFSLIAVAIYQISLIDLLEHIGIKPDGFFGHSFGELICAYLDGICTVKEVLDTTLVVCRLKQRYEECDRHNKPINNFLFEKGAMAVVGLNWDKTIKEIEESKVQKVNAACNNSDDCVTISGAEDQVEMLQEHLTKKKIFNRKVASCGFAFHCDLVREFYDHLLKEFNKIFKNKVQRSNKWISTALNPFNETESVSWLNNDLKMNKKKKQTFAQYFVDCILNPVLFKEACDKMVSDLTVQEDVNQVFVLEIAPRTFLTSLMKNNTSMCASLTYLPTFKMISKDDLYKKPNTNLIVLLNIIGILNENGIYSSLSKLYNLSNCSKPLNGLINGNHLINEMNKSFKLSSSSSSISNSPIITNRLSFSSLIRWDHSIEFPVPSYPKFFNSSVDQNKIDLNSTNYKDYLPDRTSRFRLPISFYLELVLNQFKKINSSIQFSTLHIQDLIIYRLEELNEQELEKVQIEIIEFSEQSTFGQIFIFTVENHNKELILNGNLAVSNLKFNQLEISKVNFKKLSVLEFYENLNCKEDMSQHLIRNLSVSNGQIEGELGDKNKWTNQFDGLIQLYAYFNKQSIMAEIDKQTLQIHSITIRLEDELDKDNKICFDDLMNVAQSKQIELKCIQLNSLNGTEVEIVSDENCNIDLNNKKMVIDELNKNKIKVGYFKTGLYHHNNLSFIGQDKNKNHIVGFLNKDNKFENNFSSSKSLALPHLSLLNSYLIATDLLNEIFKLNYDIQRSFLNCEQNLDLLIALSDLLTLRNCETYILLNDSIKINLIKNCFSERKNLHIINLNLKEDFDIELLRLTDGEAAQLVVSKSNNKQEFNKSINCLSLNGKFINLNNEQTCVQNLSLGMSIFLKNIDFKGITLSDLNLEQILRKKQINVNSILNSIDENIIKQLNELDRFQLEKFFNFYLISS